jgi:hypothetical protein
VFIAAIILAIIAVISTLVAMASKDRATKADAFMVTCVACALAVVSLGAACVSIVSTRHVGIVKAYGKPTGRTTGSGLQWTKPWEGVDDEWDATRQSYNPQAKCEQPGDGSLWVSIAGQRQMCVHVQINWETVTGQQAADNWATYRKTNDGDRFETFIARQVNPGLSADIASVFRDYDPLGLVDPKTSEAQTPNLAGQYTPLLLAAINKNLGQDIKIMSVSWGSLVFDAKTQAAIAQYAANVYASRNLAIDETNAKTRARIASGSGVPSAVQQCLDLVKSEGKGEPGLCLASSNVQLTKPVG